MRITRTDKKYPNKELEERIGLLGRYRNIIGRRRVLILPLLLLLAVLLYLLLNSGWLVTYGRVMAREINISATSVSRISEIHVALGDRVKAGEVLVSLSKHSLNAEIYRSKIALQKKMIELEGLMSRGGAPSTRSELAAAEQQLEQQRLKIKTTRASFQRKVKARDNAKKDLASKKVLLLLDGITAQQLEQAEDLRDDIQSQVNIAYALLQEQKAAVKRAEYAVAQAEKNLRFTESGMASDIELKKLEIEQLEQVLTNSNVVLADQDLFAPTDGTVTWVTKYAGEVIDHRDTILNITADAPRWVEAYIYAGDWQKLHTGAQAKVRIEHEGGSWMEGCVVMSYPTQRPIEQEYPIGQRLSRSPRRMDENILPVVILLDKSLPATYPTGTVVDVKIENSAARVYADCQSNPPENTPGD